MPAPRCLAVVAGLLPVAVLAAAAELAAYGADPKQTTVSGLSSGAFMAVQLQVAYSASIAGAGVVAGGPYYCAVDNVYFAGICMGQVASFPPGPSSMVGFAKGFAASHEIDSLAHLKRRRVYVFSGTKDNIVVQPAVAATVEFFRRVGVTGARLKYVDDVPAGHAFIAPDFGNECAANASPYISHCTVAGSGYDQAGAILQHLYGTLHPPGAVPARPLLAFDQRAYATPSSALADTGFLYVPPGCEAAGARCRVHVALHGCRQSAESVGDAFTAGAGYNRWADVNRILVLYPQVDKSPANPDGCWDWWGYSGADYAYKSAPQMRAIVSMVKRLTERP
ncbi:MAG: extracellular catalytic domain type 2 short-chain-length polyhydroxyalkanoate depolymerase [Caldimonas sp.]